MQGRDPWAAGFLLLFGLLASFEARKLTVGELGRPGPGFFPFYLALIFSTVSLALLIHSLWIVRGRAIEAQAPEESLQHGKVAWTFLGLFVYALILEPFGFLLPTFILMFFLFRVVDPLPWALAIGSSLATSILTYALFKLWLQIPLPAGPWGL